MKVVHLTSAHSRSDVRIFVKQCRGLVGAGHDVSLVVADGKGEEFRDGVQILDVGRPLSRLDRMWKTARRVAVRASEIPSELIHIHDPELLPYRPILQRAGRAVIFDAHEDLPRQVLSKPYLRPFLRGPISHATAWFEKVVCRRLDAVVAATPSIRDKFLAMGVRSIDVNNFPLLDELSVSEKSGELRREVCYIGGIAEARGIREIIAAIGMSELGARLNLVGLFVEPALHASVSQMPGWSAVNATGFLDREGVRETLARSAAGLVTLHPTPAYREALPVKLFEYMAAGLPVIASDFPIWREIVFGSDCGLLVDPLDPRQIAEAIDRLLGDPDLARRLGQNGRHAVESRYNWSAEEQKLLELYDNVASKAYQKLN